VGINSVIYRSFKRFPRVNRNKIILKSKLLKINIVLDDGSLKEDKSTEFIIKNVIYG